MFFSVRLSKRMVVSSFKLFKFSQGHLAESYSKNQNIALFVGSELVISHTLHLKCLMHVREQIFSCWKDTFLLTPIRMVIVSLEIYFNRLSKLEFWRYMHMAFTTFNSFVMFNLYTHVIFRCVICTYGQNSNLESLFYIYMYEDTTYTCLNVLCVYILACLSISDFFSLCESRIKMMIWVTSKFTKIFCSFFIAKTIQKNLVTFSCLETEGFVGYMTHRSIFAHLHMQKQTPVLHRLYQWLQFHSLFI